MKTMMSTAAIVASLAMAQVNAQPARYPDKPIKILVGFAAGGGTDVAARLLAVKLTESLGQSVVVDNRTDLGAVLANLGSWMRTPTTPRAATRSQR